jgi:hypothetical protein
LAKAKRAPASPALIEDLVAAIRVLSNEGVVDGFGHVSVRDDGEAGVSLLARSMAGLVTAADRSSMPLDDASDRFGANLAVRLH